MHYQLTDSLSGDKDDSILFYLFLFVCFFKVHHATQLCIRIITCHTHTDTHSCIEQPQLEMGTNNKKPGQEKQTNHRQATLIQWICVSVSVQEIPQRQMRSLLMQHTHQMATNKTGKQEMNKKHSHRKSQPGQSMHKFSSIFERNACTCSARTKQE